MHLKILYFASVRERLGKSEETVDLPAGITTIADLLGWLATRGPEYAAALPPGNAIRAAINQTHAGLTSPLVDAREIAFFPPVTGG